MRWIIAATAILMLAVLAAMDRPIAISGDDIVAMVLERSSNSASISALPFTGATFTTDQEWLDTSVEPAAIRRFAGSEWKPISSSGSWQAVYRSPSAPIAGQIDNSTSVVRIWDGKRWVPLGVDCDRTWHPSGPMTIAQALASCSPAISMKDISGSIQ